MQRQRVSVGLQQRHEGIDQGVLSVAEVRTGQLGTLSPLQKLEQDKVRLEVPRMLLRLPRNFQRGPCQYGGEGGEPTSGHFAGRAVGGTGRGARVSGGGTCCDSSWQDIHPLFHLHPRSYHCHIAFGLPRGHETRGCSRERPLYLQSFQCLHHPRHHYSHHLHYQSCQYSDLHRYINTYHYRHHDHYRCSYFTFHYF
ncbi:uncharacterized protein LOC123520120 [Portunus trituberculatus]|uniref:uncharacterized protein LOC123520120 n=1 Tax=Portunus trituberculatus TaxID=210409 RepID=UPI001E1CD2DD|nr:uncharacterized protein LOC123520120 [Portunus trituberculatus]